MKLLKLQSLKANSFPSWHYASLAASALCFIIFVFYSALFFATQCSDTRVHTQKLTGLFGGKPTQKPPKNNLNLNPILVSFTTNNEIFCCLKVLTKEYSVYNFCSYSKLLVQILNNQHMYGLGSIFLTNDYIFYLISLSYSVMLQQKFIILSVVSFKISSQFFSNNDQINTNHLSGPSKSKELKISQ